MNIAIPKPKIIKREIHTGRLEKALNQGLDPVVAAILAGRPFHPEYSPLEVLQADVKELDSPYGLADLGKAVDRIVLAIQNNEVIGIETDHDCDGQTSHAVLYEAFVHYFGYPKAQIRSYIGHRLKEGYGLSAALTDRILQDEIRPSLIITADNGSSDEKSIGLLKTQGIDVIVTDHHEIPNEGIPKSAVAVLNPTREDCGYPDRSIAGCMVAWLLMAAVRQALIERHLPVSIPKLGGLLDFVAVGTIADCVSIAKSKNNRIVVTNGMQRIEKFQRPCWQALSQILSKPLRSEDLGFKIGPLLNSDGRLACAFGSVSFLLSESVSEARQWVAHLQQQNVSRKSIQERITKLGIAQASQQYLQGKSSISIVLEEGHAGVHGISASRIKDMFGRPTVIFCPKQESPELLTGSARSISGLHLKNALQEVKQHCPEIIEKFGGHEGAAGLTIIRSGFEVFSAAFEAVVQARLTAEAIGPVIYTDGRLDDAHLNIDFIHGLLSQLEPFGREFESPQFEAEVEIMTIQWMGERKNHARLGMHLDDLWLNGVWFFCREDEQDAAPIAVGDRAQIVYEPKIETFRDERRLTCMIQYCEKIVN